MACEHCTDPGGLPCFPTYGPAPQRVPGDLVGFTASVADEGMGVHWCPYCGDGRPHAEGAPCR